MKILILKKWAIGLLDQYFFRPYLYDLFLCIVITTVFYWRREFYVKDFDTKNFDNIISNITATIASFTGFIITALTVIVTVKASLQIRHIKNAENGLEMILTSNNYKRILKVFQFAIIELLIALGAIYLFWIPYFNIPYYLYLIVISCSIVILFTTIFRITYVFFNIIFMEFYKRE